MIEIERGYFLMGSPTAVAPIYIDETPARECVVDRRFAVGKYPVTFAEYNEFLHDVARELPAAAFIAQAGAEAPRLPIVGVSWTEAGHYCEWLFAITNHRYRLLTEMEWEYMCRSGTETNYWWGDTFDASKANCRPEDAPRFPPRGFDDILSTLKFVTPVDRYAPNPWGICDVHGNVWEWVQDVYDDRRTQPGTYAPKGPDRIFAHPSLLQAYRVLRRFVGVCVRLPVFAVFLGAMTLGMTLDRKQTQRPSTKKPSAHANRGPWEVQPLA
jgi:formylglycine-generating enzyme required for sulfatase activity